MDEIEPTTQYEIEKEKKLSNLLDQIELDIYRKYFTFEPKITLPGARFPSSFKRRSSFISDGEELCTHEKKTETENANSPHSITEKFNSKQYYSSYIKIFPDGTTRPYFNTERENLSNIIINATKRNDSHSTHPVLLIRIETVKKEQDLEVLNRLKIILLTVAINPEATIKYDQEQYDTIKQFCFKTEKLISSSFNNWDNDFKQLSKTNNEGGKFNISWNFEMIRCYLDNLLLLYGIFEFPILKMKYSNCLEIVRNTLTSTTNHTLKSFENELERSDGLQKEDLIPLERLKDILVSSQILKDHLNVNDIPNYQSMFQEVKDILDKEKQKIDIFLIEGHSKLEIFLNNLKVLKSQIIDFESYYNTTIETVSKQWKNIVENYFQNSNLSDFENTHLFLSNFKNTLYQQLPAVAQDYQNVLPKFFPIQNNKEIRTVPSQFNVGLLDEIILDNWEKIQEGNIEILTNRKECYNERHQGEWACFTFDKMRNDKEVVWKAVSQNGNNLQFASESLKNDKEIVSKAVSQHGCAIQFASEFLKNDKGIVLKAVSQTVDALQYVPTSLKYDKDVILRVVEKDPHSLFLYYPEIPQNSKKEVILDQLKILKEEKQIDNIQLLLNEPLGHTLNLLFQEILVSQIQLLGNHSGQFENNLIIDKIGTTRTPTIFPDRTKNNSIQNSCGKAYEDLNLLETKTMIDRSSMNIDHYKTILKTTPIDPESTIRFSKIEHYNNAIEQFCYKTEKLISLLNWNNTLRQLSETNGGKFYNPWNQNHCCLEIFSLLYEIFFKFALHTNELFWAEFSSCVCQTRDRESMFLESLFDDNITVLNEIGTFPILQETYPNCLKIVPNNPSNYLFTAE
eukprot:TRINITY_DN19473_c0_g1_i2.p1 TRINITY_DN19473_c0_g1~~TRINITY_DN19473_c0_g1_i2.p1  ORF type:complete len:906 (+),score=233.45 TRINITY_DN19473_c0_g1_i2:164-2719(+)